MKEFLEGNISDTQIDDELDEAVKSWHDGQEDGKPLHEHLGFTWDQYEKWVGDFGYIFKMKKEYKLKKPV